MHSQERWLLPVEVLRTEISAHRGRKRPHSGPLEAGATKNAIDGRATRNLRGTVYFLLLLFGALLGTATLTITATSGTVSRSTTVKLNVQ